MEVIAIPAELIAALKQPLPKEAVKAHPTKPYLSTIKVIYAVERLNDVFGLGGWTDEYEIVDDQHEMVVVKGRLTVPQYGIQRTAFGGNDNADRGDAYKGACTDALSKMCSMLYIGMDVYKGHPDAPRPAAAANPAAEKCAEVASQSAPAIQTAIGSKQVPGVDVIEVQNKNGQRGEYLIVKTYQGKAVGSCFDNVLFRDVMATVGHKAEFVTKANGQYTNIVGVKSIDGKALEAF